jgi:hypothetical protein
MFIVFFMAVLAGPYNAIDGNHQVPAGLAYVLHPAHAYTYQWHKHRAQIYEVGSGLVQYEFSHAYVNGYEVYSQAYGDIDEGKVPVFAAARPPMERNVLLPCPEVIFHTRTIKGL